MHFCSSVGVTSGAAAVATLDADEEIEDSSLAMLEVSAPRPVLDSSAACAMARATRGARAKKRILMVSERV